MYRNIVLDYYSKKNYRPNRTVEGNSVYSQFEDSTIFDYKVFSKYFLVRINLTINKEKNKIIELFHNGVLKVNDNSFSLPHFGPFSENKLFMSYIPKKGVLFIHGKVPLKIIYQNYKFNSIKDLVNSKIFVDFNVNNILSTPYLPANKNDFFSSRKELKYDSLECYLVAKKFVGLSSIKWQKVGKHDEHKFEGYVSQKNLSE